MPTMDPVHNEFCLLLQAYATKMTPAVYLFLEGSKHHQTHEQVLFEYLSQLCDCLSHPVELTISVIQG
jgi:hypothetical protein